MAYSTNTEWRNRAEFINGREQVREFLRRKWNKELDYKLKKYYWAHTDNRIAVRFEYEYHDDSGLLPCDLPCFLFVPCELDGKPLAHCNDGLRELVPRVWQRELGIRRAWLHDQPICLHQ
eukprot:scaffold382_cov380-Prasinococcus_capsulatus_cf.AAC.20